MNRAEDSPKDRIWYSDQPQSDPDRNSVGRVHDELHQQIAADAGRRVVERLRRARQIARAGEPDRAVTEIVALQKQEDHEDDDDACGRERADQRAGDGGDDLQ